MELLAWPVSATEALVRAAAATPSPSGTGTVDDNLVTPGPWGFAIMAILGAAVILLVIDMLRRIRRGRYREEVREELDAEEAARAEQADAAGSAPGGGTGATDGEDPRTRPGDER